MLPVQTDEYLLLAGYIGVLLYVSYTDLRWRIVPNKVTYPAILLAALSLLFRPQPSQALWGAVLGIVPLLLPVLLYGPERAGVGDVKLGLFIGLVLGFPGTLFALIIAFAAAFVTSLAGILARRLGRKSTIPFAPFLALGGIVALLLPL